MKDYKKLSQIKRDNIVLNRQVIFKLTYVVIFLVMIIVLTS